jgi:SNF2 family DNA or RNA helicase
MNWELSFLPDVGDRHTGKLAVKVPDTYKDIIKQVPGYAWSTMGKVSVVPRAWPAVLNLGTLATELKAHLAPDAEVLAWYKENAESFKQLRQLAGELGTGHKAEGLSYYPHQLAGATWLLADGEMSGRALLDQTGAGKTGTVIRALQEGKLTEKGPALVVCPESVMTTGWSQGLAFFAPELRTVEITGTAVQRRKKIEAIADGQFDVAIIGYSNLRTSTRFEAFPGQALRRCVKCGGPRLTMGKTDPAGNPLPDIYWHEDVQIREIGLGYRGVCRFEGCDWTGKTHLHPAQCMEEVGEHSLKYKKISELTPAQCQTHMMELNEIPWSVIIADECHRALNPKSQTTRSLWGIAKYAPSDPRRWGLTGTPVSTDYDQVWPILHFLDNDAWPGKSKWVDWHCTSGYNWAGFWEVTGLRPEREKEFRATFDAVTRRVLKEQVLDLPPKLRWGSLEERLTMSGEQLRVYKDMKEEMLAMVEEGAITASNVLVQARRLTMLASGTGYPIGDDGTMGLRAPSVKLSHLISMWNDGEWKGEQVALLFSSRKALRMMEQGLYEAGVLRPETTSIIAGDVSQSRRTEDINDFQAGIRKTVLLTYAAGGTGITLTAASTVIVVERDWSSILNLQGEDRFHRIGSERHNAIVYRDLVVENSNEIAQLARLDQNAETLESIVHDKDKLRALFS